MPRIIPTYDFVKNHCVPFNGDNTVADKTMRSCHPQLVTKQSGTRASKGSKPLLGCRTRSLKGIGKAVMRGGVRMLSQSQAQQEMSRLLNAL